MTKQPRPRTKQKPSRVTLGWTLGALLVLALVVAYQSVWHAGFIWDDDAHLTKNPCIIGPLGFKGIWRTAAATYYPLVLTSFWLQHALWGLSPLPYHLVNVAMHAACAILLWRVLRHLQIKGAWLGATIWALHPVQVESVAWITELKNTQSCFFYLLSILFFLKWRESAASAEDRHGTWPHYVMSLLCAIAAILSKSSTVMLPVVLGLCWWWMDGSWRWRSATKLIPFLCLSVVAAAWTIWEQKFHSQAVGAEWNQALPERVIIAGRIAWFYLGKLVWPYPLVFIYPRWTIDASQPLAYLPTLTAAGGLIALWWKRNGPLRPVFFAAAYFVISLFPVLDFFDVYFFRYSFVGDHLQYLACIGPLVLTGTWITALFGFVAKRLVFLKVTCYAALLCALGLFTWRQAGIYRSSDTLWSDTLAKNPKGWIVQNGIATNLLQKGQVAEALVHLQQALESNPNNVITHSNFGYALLQMGRLNESVEHLQRALEIEPNYSAAHSNMANTLLQMGRADEAVAHLRTALELNPDDSEAQKNMAWVLATSPQARLRDGAKAVELAEHSYKLTDGRDPVVGATLAAAYAEVGRFDDAVKTAGNALRLADESGNAPLAEGIRAHIESYRLGQPVRDVR